MKTTILFYVFTLLAIFSCNNPQKSANQKLETEMIAVHDEIMPHMGAFNRNSDQIDSILNNLSEAKAKSSELDTTQTRKDLLGLKQHILDANDNMNDWMHKLNLDFEGKTDEEVKTYLETELEAIKNIELQFEKVIKEKESLLDPFLNQ